MVPLVPIAAVLFALPPRMIVITTMVVGMIGVLPRRLPRARMVPLVPIAAILLALPSTVVVVAALLAPVLLLVPYYVPQAAAWTIFFDCFVCGVLGG